MNSLSPAIAAMDAVPEITSDPMDDIPDPIEQARKIRSGILEGNPTLKSAFLTHLKQEHDLCIPLDVRAIGGWVRGKLGLLIPIAADIISADLLEIRGDFNGVRYKFVA